MEFFEEEACSYPAPIDHHIDIRYLQNFSFSEIPIKIYPYSTIEASGLKELTSLDREGLERFFDYFDPEQQLPRKMVKEFVDLISLSARKVCKIFLVNQTLATRESSTGFYDRHSNSVFVSINACDYLFSLLRVLRHMYTHLLQREYGIGDLTLGIDVYDFVITNVFQNGYRESYESAGIGHESIEMFLRSEMEALTIECNIYMWLDIEIEVQNNNLVKSRFYPSENREATILASLVRGGSVFDSSSPLLFESYLHKDIKQKFLDRENEEVQKNIWNANNRRSRPPKKNLWWKTIIDDLKILAWIILIILIFSNKYAYVLVVIYVLIFLSIISD